MTLTSAIRHQQDDVRPIGTRTTGVSVAVQAYLRCGYSALSHSVVDYWMPRLSGNVFKLIVFFLRSTVGDREKRFQGDLELRIPLDDICARAGLNREAAITAIRELENRGLLTAARAHRQTTVYTLQLPALLDPWVGNPDSGNELRVGKADSKSNSRVGNPDLNGVLESEKPTQNGTFESGIPTPYKKTNKAAAAAVSIPKPANEPTALSSADHAEIQRISRATGIRIDGKDAIRLKAGIDRARLTLAHLRWFLAGENFSSARSPRAVLLTIAKEFPERVQGICWPDSLDPDPTPPARGLTEEELLRL